MARRDGLERPFESSRSTSLNGEARPCREGGGRTLDYRTAGLAVRVCGVRIADCPPYNPQMGRSPTLLTESKAKVRLGSITFLSALAARWQAIQEGCRG
jgi:hypothetical protein